MLIAREIAVGLVIAVFMVMVAACGPVPRNEVRSVSDSQALVTVTRTPPSLPADDVIWGKVPYCNCLATSATTNVTNALKHANLVVNLKELSPRDGWLYFVVTFGPHSELRKQVVAAMQAGGAQVLNGPP